MQGTAAVVLAALISAVKVTKSELKDQRIVSFGFGTAGYGIAGSHPCCRFGFKLVDAR